MFFCNVRDSQESWTGCSRSAHQRWLLLLYLKTDNKYHEDLIFKGNVKTELDCSSVQILCLQTFGKARGCDLRSLQADERGACLGEPFSVLAVTEIHR